MALLACFEGVAMNEEPEHAPDADPTQASAPDAAGLEWIRLVQRIQAGEAGALEELYEIFGKGIRFFIYRQLGPQDLEDRVHDAFLIVVQAIKRGEIREPARLMGFVRTIVRRQVATRIDELVQNRREHVVLEQGPVLPDQSATPEERAMTDERTALMLKVLQDMSERDREILRRFYLMEQSQDQICREMNLTETQYRLLKSRAKSRFGEMGRKALKQ